MLSFQNSNAVVFSIHAQAQYENVMKLQKFYGWLMYVKGDCISRN